MDSDSPLNPFFISRRFNLGNNCIHIDYILGKELLHEPGSRRRGACLLLQPQPGLVIVVVPPDDDQRDSEPTDGHMPRPTLTTPVASANAPSLDATSIASIPIERDWKGVPVTRICGGLDAMQVTRWGNNWRMQADDFPGTQGSSPGQNCQFARQVRAQGFLDPSNKKQLVIITRNVTAGLLWLQVLSQRG